MAQEPDSLQLQMNLPLGETIEQQYSIQMELEMENSNSILGNLSFNLQYEVVETSDSEYTLSCLPTFFQLSTIMEGNIKKIRTAEIPVAAGDQGILCTCSSTGKILEIQGQDDFLEKLQQLFASGTVEDNGHRAQGNFSEELINNQLYVILNAISAFQDHCPNFPVYEGLCIDGQIDFKEMGFQIPNNTEISFQLECLERTDGITLLGKKVAIGPYGNANFLYWIEEKTGWLNEGIASFEMSFSGQNGPVKSLKVELSSEKVSPN